MLVNKFKFYERVIKLGSYSRKYHKEATGNKKKGRKSTTSAGKGKIPPHHGVSGLLVGLHGHRR